MINDDMANKVAILYIVHFGNKEPEKVTCKDCSDFNLGFCSGGASNTLVCMYDKAKECEVRIYNEI